jgi:hypothetical protein
MPLPYSLPTLLGAKGNLLSVSLSIKRPTHFVMLQGSSLIINYDVAFIIINYDVISIIVTL